MCRLYHPSLFGSAFLLTGTDSLSRPSVAGRAVDFWDVNSLLR